MLPEGGEPIGKQALPAGKGPYPDAHLKHRKFCLKFTGRPVDEFKDCFKRFLRIKLREAL
jgi:hypothetical protein